MISQHYWYGQEVKFYDGRKGSFRRYEADGYVSVVINGTNIVIAQESQLNTARFVCKEGTACEIFAENKWHEATISNFNGDGTVDCAVNKLTVRCYVWHVRPRFLGVGPCTIKSNGQPARIVEVKPERTKCYIVETKSCLLYAKHGELYAGVYRPYNITDKQLPLTTKVLGVRDPTRIFEIVGIRLVGERLEYALNCGDTTLTVSAQLLFDNFKGFDGSILGVKV